MVCMETFGYLCRFFKLRLESVAAAEELACSAGLSADRFRDAKSNSKSLANQVNKSLLLNRWIDCVQ